MKRLVVLLVVGVITSGAYSYPNEPDRCTYVTPDPNNPQVGDIYDLKLNWAYYKRDWAATEQCLQASGRQGSTAR